MSIRPFALAALVPLAACGVFGGKSNDPEPAPVMSARASLRDASGGAVGTASLQQTPAGLLLSADLSGLPPGTHGFHFHEVGQCSPTFDAAGGHFNPTSRQHGIRNPGGKHAGDLPNINVPQSGSIRVDLFLADVSLTGANGLMDGNGASVMLHALADDYATDPSGGSGTRIACGVIER